MSSHHPARPPQGLPPRGLPPGSSTGREQLVDFLADRLTEDLGLVWARDEAASRPGMAGQVAVLDELLSVLRAGGLPSRRELRILLVGYGTHADYDPGWTRLLMDGTD